MEVANTSLLQYCHKYCRKKFLLFKPLMFVGKVGARTILHFKLNPQHYIKFEGRSTVNKMGHSA